MPLRQPYIRIHPCAIQCHAQSVFLQGGVATSPRAPVYVPSSNSCTAWATRSAPVRFAMLPPDCYCNSGVDRQYRGGISRKRLLTEERAVEAQAVARRVDQGSPRLPTPVRHVVDPWIATVIQGGKRTVLKGLSNTPVRIRR